MLYLAIPLLVLVISGGALALLSYAIGLAAAYEDDASDEPFHKLPDAGDPRCADILNHHEPEYRL